MGLWLPPFLSPVFFHTQVASHHRNHRIQPAPAPASPPLVRTCHLLPHLHLRHLWHLHPLQLLQVVTWITAVLTRLCQATKIIYQQYWRMKSARATKKMLQMNNVNNKMVSRNILDNTNYRIVLSTSYYECNFLQTFQYQCSKLNRLE